MKSFYEYLGIPRNASQDDIEKAYRKRYFETDPRTGGNDIEHKNVVKGHTILSNPEVRLRYDRWLMLREYEEMSNKNSNNFTTHDFISKIIKDKKGKKKTLSWIAVILLLSISIIWILFTGQKENKAIITKDEVAVCLEGKEREIKESYVKDNTDELYRDIYDFSNPNNPEFTHIKLPEDKSSKSDSKKQSENELQPYDKVCFSTGEKPYENYFGKGKYDYDSLSELTVTNHSSLDAVVLLTTVQNKVIRHVFINSGTFYTFTKIPQSICNVKVMMGREWNSSKDNGPNYPEGGFMKNVAYSQTSTSQPFNFIANKKGDYINYPTYSMTLHKVVNGNLNSYDINQNEFFKK